MRDKLSVIVITALLSFMVVLRVSSASAAPRPEKWDYWDSYDNSSGVRVDHSPWDRFLKKYLVTDDPSGINKVRYSKVTEADTRALEQYIEDMQRVTVTKLKRKEQNAYWINLYNALTVKVILDHYPVESIRDIDMSSGIGKNGPWDAELLTIEGKMITLNDIEHRILRPIFQDERVHYAVNCASMGCPDLLPDAFTAENIDRLLETGARSYINHPRGVNIQGRKMVLSSIYSWFKVDFGSSNDELLEHIKKYAASELAAQLEGFRGRISYDYDWSLNE
jgi:hypothetical protein